MLVSAQLATQTILVLTNDSILAVGELMGKVK